LVTPSGDTVSLRTGSASAVGRLGTDDGTREDRDMTEVELSRPTLHLNRRLMVGGAALIGAGGVLAATGILLGTYAVVTATRQWMKQLEVPPSEIARRRLHQARSAGAAAAEAWRNQTRKSTPA